MVHVLLYISKNLKYSFTSSGFLKQELKDDCLLEGKALAKQD